MYSPEYLLKLKLKLRHSSISLDIPTVESSLLISKLTILGVKGISNEVTTKTDILVTNKFQLYKSLRSNRKAAPPNVASSNFISSRLTSSLHSSGSLDFSKIEFALRNKKTIIHLEKLKEFIKSIEDLERRRAQKRKGSVSNKKTECIVYLVDRSGLYNPIRKKYEGDMPKMDFDSLRSPFQNPLEIKSEKAVKCYPNNKNDCKNNKDGSEKGIGKLSRNFCVNENETNSNSDNKNNSGNKFAIGKTTCRGEVPEVKSWEEIYGRKVKVKTAGYCYLCGLEVKDYGKHFEGEEHKRVFESRKYEFKVIRDVFLEEKTLYDSSFSSSSSSHSSPSSFSNDDCDYYCSKDDIRVAMKNNFGEKRELASFSSKSKSYTEGNKKIKIDEVTYPSGMGEKNIDEFNVHKKSNFVLKSAIRNVLEGVVKKVSNESNSVVNVDSNSNSDGRRSSVSGSSKEIEMTYSYFDSTLPALFRCKIVCDETGNPFAQNSVIVKSIKYRIELLSENCVTDKSLLEPKHCKLSEFGHTTENQKEVLVKGSTIFPIALLGNFHSICLNEVFVCWNEKSHEVKMYRIRDINPNSYYPFKVISVDYENLLSSKEERFSEKENNGFCNNRESGNRTEGEIVRKRAEDFRKKIDVNKFNKKTLKEKLEYEYEREIQLMALYEERQMILQNCDKYGISI